jgi:hypothetical protein
MDNKINASQIEVLEIFQSKLKLNGKILNSNPNLTNLDRLLA